MNKPKRDIALFDLLPEDADNPKSLLVPDGRTDVKKATKQSGRPVGRRDDQRTPKELRRTQDQEPVAAEPFFALHGERIRLSFTSFTAGVALFAVMVIFVGALEWGRRSGDFAGYRRGHAEGRESYSAETLGEIAEARRQDPATHLIDSLLVEESDANRLGTAVSDSDLDDTSTGWVQGYTYVVAQEFGEGRIEDARRAKEFLATNGVFTELVQTVTGSTQLITSQGYDIGDAIQRRLAQDLKDKVHNIGRAYYASGGGYKLEGYFKTLKAKNW